MKNRRYHEKLKRVIDAIMEQLPKKNNSNHGKKCIVICNDVLLLIANPKHIVARTLQNSGFEVEVLSNKYQDASRELADLYGLKISYANKMAPWDLLKAGMKALWIMIFTKPKELERLKFGDLLVGDLIYDSILRSEDGVFTITSIKNIGAFKQILKAAIIYYFAKNKLEEEPDYVVAQDLVYVDCIYSRMAVALGSKLVVMTTGRPSFIFEGNTEIPTFSLSYKKLVERNMNSLDNGWEKEVDVFLEEMFSGKGDWNVQNAYLNRTNASKETILNKIGINNSKKNIVIMAHCFSDAPHCTDFMIYRDYYVWLEETLKISCKNPAVNWILKPHPGRFHYNEEGVVEELYNKYQNENLYWFPEEFSAKTLKELADAVVTVNGSTAYELGCVGVPAICAGKAFYSYFGYTYNCSNVDEYYDALLNIQKIKPLSDEQVKKAKQVYYLFRKLYRLQDDFSQKSYDIHSRFCLSGNMDEANESYLELLDEQLSIEKVRESYDVHFAESLK